MKILKSLLIASVLALASITAGAEPVDVNTATAEEIAVALQGVGEKRAVAIVKFRENNGAFESLEDLTKVSGIGEKLVENNKANIKLSKPSKTN